MSDSGPSDQILDHFLPPVAAWFRETLGQPTPPQQMGWPAIAAGQNTLIVAPTGSGKTLAAFLAITTAGPAIVLLARPQSAGATWLTAWLSGWWRPTSTSPATLALKSLAAGYDGPWPCQFKSRRSLATVLAVPSLR